MSFPILAGAALILLVLAYVINVRTGRNLEESTYSKGQNFSNFLQKVSLPYLNNFDLSALEGFATEATKDSEVAFIVFYDDKKKALTEGSKEPADTTPYVIFEKQISRDDGKLMGYLKIGYKRDNLVEAQRRNSFVCLAAILFALLLVAAIVYWVAHRFDGVLSSVIDQMSTASTKLTNLGSQLSETSEASSQSTAESAASLEETSASLQQLSLTVKSNADKSKEAADLSQSSRATVQEGKGEINKLAGAMSEISESSKRIAEIIDVIEDIAFQTNLLALNAAVEAARAGEHGKGFAVVAEAVRSLAQRTSSASKDIALLIRDSSAKTGHGVEVVKRSGEVLENIVKSVMKVSELNLEIAKASQEQANGIRHINNAMGQLDTITQRNATNADQVSQSSVEMMTQSTVLLELVDKMVVLTKGQAFAHRLTTEREDEAPFAPDSGHRHAPAHGTRRRMPAGYHAPSVADVIPLPRPGSSRAVEHEHGDDDVVVEAGPADDSGRKQA